MRKAMIKKTNLQYDYSKLVNRLVTDMIVVHHTGNEKDDDLSAYQINKIHQAEGWVCIGYHYVIRKDGTIEEGRPHWTKGAHAAEKGNDHNPHTIGIHVCGNFELATPTKYQIESLALLLANLCHDYGLEITPETIVGHRQLMGTACPGKNLYNKLQIVRGKALWYQQND